MKKIFAAYGTLKKGYWNNRLLHGAKFLGEYKTPAKYTLYDGGFPVVERNGDTSILVELYETCNVHTINNVNALEGFNGIKGHPDNTFYDVDEIETPFGKADMFVMDEGASGRSRMIPSGVWNKKY